MKLVLPRGHEELCLRLFEAARAGLLPHALLFEGPDGIGKFLAARWLAAGLLCEAGPAPPCGSCGPCKRVLSGGARGNHADLLLVDPVEEETESIRVFRIAHRPDAAGNADPDDCVESFLALRAVEARTRSVLVRESHRMNAAAQNALLKTLEEPRPGTLLVLETHRPEVLLPTIRSRCVRVEFRPLAPAEAGAVLEEAGLEREEAGRFARWYEGSPGRALGARAKGYPELRGLLGELCAGRSEPLAAAAACWEIAGEFHGATPSAKARARARFVLDRALEIQRDRHRAALGVPADELVHGDLVQGPGGGPRGGPGGGGESALRAGLEALFECRGDVERNLAPEALLERAFLALAPALAPGATLSATAGGR